MVMRPDVLEEIAAASALSDGWSSGLRGPDRLRIKKRRLVTARKTKQVARVNRPTYESLPYGSFLVYCVKCVGLVEIRIGCPRPVCRHALHNT